MTDFHCPWLYQFRLSYHSAFEIMNFENSQVVYFKNIKQHLGS